MRAFILFLLPLSGCVVYSSSPPKNSAPWFSYADGGCFWDNGYRDYIWYFDVDVEDDLGPSDVAAVWADVYDNRAGIEADSFDLNPEPGKSWYSSWIGATTYLDPGYGAYEIVLSAQDYDGAIGSTSIFPVPCAQ